MLNLLDKGLLLRKNIFYFLVKEVKLKTKKIEKNFHFTFNKFSNS